MQANNSTLDEFWDALTKAAEVIKADAKKQGINCGMYDAGVFLLGFGADMVAFQTNTPLSVVCASVLKWAQRSEQIRRETEEEEAGR